MHFTGKDARQDARWIRFGVKQDEEWLRLNADLGTAQAFGTADEIDDLLSKMADRVRDFTAECAVELENRFGAKYAERVVCNLTELQMMACGLM